MALFRTLVDRGVLFYRSHEIPQIWQAEQYMMQGQIPQSRNNYPAAWASFAAGVKTCPKEPALWMLASRLEGADGKGIKARALLEKARLVNSGNELLWVESVGVEEQFGGAAHSFMRIARVSVVRSFMVNGDLG
jgi:pre-mRNA-processing factor 6